MDRKARGVTRLAWFAACALCLNARAQESTLLTATPAALFPGEEAAALAKTLPADHAVHFRVRAPENPGASGVLVFVSPRDSGEPPAQWLSVLEQKRLLWIAADGFGNERPTAGRMLAAVMALKLVQQKYDVDARRAYVAGMSGGGRVASKVITHFPQLFAGAFCIVGADFWMPTDTKLAALVASRRYVFLTGTEDFNRHELQAVQKRYLGAGVSQVLLIDAPGFGHELASPEQLARAIDFLDAR